MKLLRLLPRFQKARRVLALLEARESWSRAEIETYQLERLNQLWRHAQRHCAWYLKVRQQGAPEVFTSLAEFRERMPLLERSDIVRNPQAFLSQRRRAGQWVQTSGTTTAPLRVFREHRAHLGMLRAKYRFYAAWNVDPLDRMVWLWGSEQLDPSEISERLRRFGQHCQDVLRNRLRLSAARLAADDLQQYLRRIESARPRALYGLSRATYLLAKESCKVEFQCDSIQLVNVTGEPATPQMLSTIEKAFHAPAVMEYGCTELGYMAGEMPDRTLRVREDIVLLETLPYSDGLYEVVVTDLLNLAFPLIRYRIGDLIQQPVTSQDQGFAVLSRIIGRDTGMLYSAAGQPLSPVELDGLFDRCFAGAWHRYRLQQAADGSIVGQLEIPGRAAKAMIDGLLHQLSETLAGLPVQLETLPEGSPRWTKHRVVVSQFRGLHAASSNSAST